MNWDAIGTVVAFVALIQFWVSWAWKRFLRPGRVEFYESGQLEIGFGSFGAHIGLMGTVRAIHSDQFVRTFDAKVTRLSDTSTHKFNWEVARISDGSGNSRVAPALSFMVTQLQPIHINPILVDQINGKAVKELIERFRPLYREAETTLGTDSNVDDEDGRRLTAFSNATTVGSDGQQIISSLERSCFWESDTYRLELTVETDQAGKSFTKSWLFVISTSDATGLIGNASKIASASLNQGDEQFYFAYVEFIEDSAAVG